jgi:tetratricopeptide (TPR) repeat protein
MSTSSPGWWLTVSPYLDQALAMTEEERNLWVASLREQNPEIAKLLQAVLDEHHLIVKEGFLEESPAPQPPGLAGQGIGAYTLVSPIGQGGMGSVWLAERTDGRFQRRAAVKFLNIGLAGSGGEERFKREGSMLGKLSHPHVAELLDAGVSSTGVPYLILEYVEGEHIDQHCERRALDVEARIRLFLDVLDAVAHAHANLIVHRDLKPSNVLVRVDGNVKLLDFGVAKLLEEGSDPSLTRDKGGALTPEYAAPEQVTGAPVTTATDVYSLGILLYVLLAGQHPAGLGPHSPSDLMKAIIEDDPPLMSVAKSRAAEGRQHLLRGDLDTIVAKAMKKNPLERYGSVTALADDLRRYLDHQPIRARPDTFAYRATKFVRRNRTAVALASLALLATIAGIAGTLFEAHGARKDRDFAIRQLSRAEAINDLNSFLLSDAAPSGKPFTVNELLARAQHILERDRADSDANRVELLVSIGYQYSTQDEAARARAVLERAYQLSRGLSEPWIRAEASCALAGSRAYDEDFDQGEALFQEGLREVPSTPQFSVDRNFCLLRGSEVARERGDGKTGIARAEAARAALQQSPFRAETAEIDTAVDLAESYRMSGENRKAIVAFERAAASLTALGRDDTETAVVLFNNWGLALNRLGQPLAAEKVYRRAIGISRDSKNEDAVSPMVLNNYASVLVDLGRLDEAADYAERAYAKAQQTGHQAAESQALFERARIYCAQHDFNRAAEMVAEVEPRLRKILPPGHYAFASLASHKATIALGRGDVQGAQRFADQAVAIFEATIQAGGEGSDRLPPMLMRRANIELESGRKDQAAADAQRALDMLQTSSEPGSLSTTAGRAYLSLGKALQAQGKLDQARNAFHSAAANLQSALGPDNLETRSAVQLAQ